MQLCAKFSWKLALRALFICLLLAGMTAMVGLHFQHANGEEAAKAAAQTAQQAISISMGAGTLMYSLYSFVVEGTGNKESGKPWQWKKAHFYWATLILLAIAMIVIGRYSSSDLMGLNLGCSIVGVFVFSHYVTVRQILPCKQPDTEDIMNASDIPTGIDFDINADEKLPETNEGEEKSQRKVDNVTHDTETNESRGIASASKAFVEQKATAKKKVTKEEKFTELKKLRNEGMITEGQFKKARYIANKEAERCRKMDLDKLHKAGLLDADELRKAKLVEEQERLSKIPNVLERQGASKSVVDLKEKPTAIEVDPNTVINLASATDMKVLGFSSPDGTGSNNNPHGNLCRRRLHSERLLNMFQ